MLLDQLCQFSLLSEHREEGANEFVIIVRPPAIVNLKDSHDSYNSLRVKCSTILPI